MNKTQFRDAVATKSGLTKVDVDKALTAIEDVVKQALKKREEIVWTGFVKFYLNKVAEKVQAKPGLKSIKGPITVPAHWQAKVKAGNDLKVAVK